MRIRADETTYRTAEVLGTPALYSDFRIDRKTIPEGMHLYEIRHSDDDWGDPCQLARGVLVNFYGTILTSEPFQLKLDGRLDLSEDDFSFTDEPENTIPVFLKEHPPKQENVMDFFIADTSENRFLYTQSEQCDREHGCIGHLRGDFGSGKQFYTTWWPHQNDVLNTPEFKADIDRVANWLRHENSPLKDFDSMQRFCRVWEQYARIPNTTIPEYGFSVVTQKYRYMLRCRPIKGDYQFYLYCYERKAMERALAQPKKEKGSEAR